ncbi:type IV secretory system conjugative DNA transfer family protein [Paenibacillus ihuae]|uniref:type IV secretory system conjugative DNA transfer family protein n=1 Tax=Paenibacillus ihuae TaxID=1232431 RepID=UPI0006D53141|nr:type IV secretory system conjugative DNA transfer family protein [Paenibacillus ihuae]
MRYYSEDCKLELFTTVPTKDRQSELKVLKRGDRAQHGQIIGGTGAGKTLLATNLITQDLLNDFIGSTIIEPKGSLINRLSNFMDRTGRTYRRLDPEYEFTDCLNPFFVPEGKDIEPMTEANVSAFHGYLGPDSEQYFKSRSTQLLRVGIKALKMVMGNDCTYNDLNRLIQPINDDFRAEIMSELIGRESEVPLLLEYTRNMASGGKLQEHAMQTYSNLYDYLSELTSNKYIQRIFCGPSTFNIDDSLSNGEVVLVNGAYGTLQTLTYTVGRLYLNLLRASTFRRNLKEKVRPHQLTVDEVEMFADEEFSTFLEMAREFEVYVNVIHQGNVQMEDVSERLAGMVKQNAVQKFILAGLDNDDAEYYADMIGEEYQIGQSSGTDEMSTTGFKTQLKEEKRYRILPSQITRLKGYNPETGEPGECLFRGVQNNVRMDPVIGLVYPLPRKLFAPIEVIIENDTLQDNKDEVGQEECPVSIVKENSMDTPLQSSVDGVGQEQVKKLEKIKQKAMEAKKQKNTAAEKEDGSIDNVIRNSVWDTGGEEGEKVETINSKTVESEIIPVQEKQEPQQASINTKLNELEKKLTLIGRAGRINSDSEGG